MLVERLAHDHATEVDLAQGSERLEVVELADAAGVKPATADDAGDALDLVEVGALEHPVLVHVRVDERAHAAVLQALDDRVGGHLRRLLPARGRDVAAAGVDRDDDPVAERAEHVVEEVDVRERGGAEDHPLRAGAQRVADRGQGAQAAAVLDRHGQLVGDPLEVVQRLGRAALRAVEVDDVQKAGALVDPRPGGGQRVVLVDGLRVEVPADQPHGLALGDVDGGVEDHAGTPAQSSVKFRRSARPAWDDFSGWNWQPNTLPRAATDTNSPP